MAALIISATFCDHLGGFRFLLAISYNSALSMASSNSIFSGYSQVTSCLLVQLRVGCSSHCSQMFVHFQEEICLRIGRPPDCMQVRKRFAKEKKTVRNLSTGNQHLFIVTDTGILLFVRPTNSVQAGFVCHPASVVTNGFVQIHNLTLN